VAEVYNLYIGDNDDNDILTWLQENVEKLERTTKEEWNWFNTYHGMNNSWIMESSDVSDTSSKYDIISQITFTTKEDAIMCGLRFGVTVHG